MKIGIVSPYDWSYPGGVREHIRHLSSQFLQMGHDVRILAPATHVRDLAAERHIFYNLGKTAPFPFNGSVARIAIDPMLSWRLRKLLRHSNFDVLHIHEPLVPGLSLAALRLSHTLNVGTFHTFSRPHVTSPYHLAYTSAAPFLRSYFRRLAGHIAVSHAAHQFASRYFNADYTIIPNGVDLSRFHPDTAPFPQLRDGKRNILFVGRFEKRKGARYLVRAIPLIRQHYPNTRFIFVGEGSLRYELQHYIHTHNLHDVIFTGYVSDADLPRYFASADIFCSPAIDGESLGIVLLEAMASGTPVVASNITGYATVVTHEHDGLLTPPKNSVALGETIARLLKDEQLHTHLVKNSQQTVQNYAWSRVASRILDYYYTLLYEYAANRQPVFYV